MKYYEVELVVFDYENGERVEKSKETYKFRMTGDNAIALEKKIGKSIIRSLNDVSVTNIINILKHIAKKKDGSAISDKEASSLYDLFIENDYTMGDIIDKVIMETYVLSGFLKKEELEDLKEEEEARKEELKKFLQKE